MFMVTVIVMVLTVLYVPVLSLYRIYVNLDFKQINHKEQRCEWREILSLTNLYVNSYEYGK